MIQNTNIRDRLGTEIGGYGTAVNFHLRYIGMILTSFRIQHFVWKYEMLKNEFRRKRRCNKYFSNVGDY